MNFNDIIRYIAYFLYFLVVISWPFRQKKIEKNLGNKILDISKKTSIITWVAIIIAPLLILLQRFKHFELFVGIILSATSIIAAEIVLKERAFKKIAGVYEKGIVLDGRYIPFIEIISIPSLAYESSPGYENVLKLVTEKSGELYIGFSSQEELESVVNAILSQEPRLKPE
ncbi:MAG: hypothetical protein J6B32_07890 [Spirochaetaceae bacterium]|nr:hypothetical protein [Spirochaetaceae bacterium]